MEINDIAENKLLSNASMMVRVISCHHFLSQDVFLSDQEPVALTSAQGKLLVATAQHCIEVHDLDSRGNVLHSFPAIDQVKQLIYCDIGNYIVTLERKLSRHSSPVTHVRIYFNWWVDLKGQPMRVRIAGCVTPSSQGWGNQFEMVELPLAEIALAITCCKKTAALAVSLGKIISVYCLSTKIHDISKQKFQDFDHFLDIEIGFTVYDLNICEGYFACMSDNQIQVFKVSIDKEEELQVLNCKTCLNTEKCSCIFEEDTCKTVDENFVEWRFESCKESGTSDIEFEEQIKRYLHPDSFPVTILLHGIEKNRQLDSNTQNYEVHGPVLSVKGFHIKAKVDPKIFEVWPSLLSTNVTCVTFLYRQFILYENQTGLLGLHLIPFYQSESLADASVAADPLSAAITTERDLFSLPWSPLSSVSSPHLKAVGCFFSTPQEGFLYDVTKGTSLLCNYPYTSTLKSVVVEHSLLHALTDTGLETYTLRLAHCAIQHAENVDRVKNACPSSKEAVCLLGLRPFLGVEQLVMTDNFLVLVSAMDDSISSSESSEGNNCTLYSLKKPSPQEVFSDLLELAMFHKTSSPHTYLHLLNEAHMILRTHLFLHKNMEPIVGELYRKSCTLLGDHFLCSDLSSEKSLAVPYYHLSQLHLEVIVQRSLDFHNQMKHSGVLKTLILYLNSVILDNQHLDKSPITQSIAEIILDVYAEESPGKLWKLILCPRMKNFKIDRVILMLKRRITSKRNPQSPTSIAADTIAIVVLLLRKGNSDAAQNMILSLAKAELVPILIEEHLMWDHDALSSFGKLVKQTRPDAFVELLLHLTVQKKFQTNDIIQIFQRVSLGTEVHMVPLLKEFLETLYSGKRQFTEDDSSGVTLLVKIYLTRLSEPKAQNTLKSHASIANASKSAMLYGARPSWLNEMPPFNEKGISRSCLNNNSKREKHGKNNIEFCPCWACNEDLLRLQSLLSQVRTFDTICNMVLEFLNSLKIKICGHISLEVLCSKESEAVNILMKSCPGALLTYALNSFEANHEKWNYLFSLLHQFMRNNPCNDPNYQIYVKTYHGVLGHLAEILDPPTFISLLPKGQNSTFLPHVKRCCEKEQAEQLKNKIVALGKEIKAMM